MQADNFDIKERIQATIDYIEDNPEKKIKLEELAEIACYSVFHYHRVFKEIVGRTAMDYLRKRRLAKAAQDLKETSQPIVDIALKYQFYSQESFTRAFTGEYGISPARFRRNMSPVTLLYRKNIVKRAIQQNAPQISRMRMAA